MKLPVAVVDAISVMLKNIGENNNISTSRYWGGMEVPNTDYRLLQYMPEAAITYLEPLLECEVLVNRILNTILYIAEMSQGRRVFHTLLHLCKRHPNLRREILGIIARAFRRKGGTAITYDDVSALLRAESLDDLADRVIVLGYIFENTSDQYIAELLLSLAEKTYGFIMRSIVNALVRIFRSSKPLLKRYGKIFARLDPYRAEALIRTIAILQERNSDAYFSNLDLKFMIMHCLLRGSIRLKAQAIIALGYIFKDTGAIFIVPLLRRFIGIHRDIDIAIARALGMVFSHRSIRIVRNVLLELLSKRDMDVVREALIAIEKIFEGTQDYSLMRILERYYISDLDDVFCRTLSKIDGSTSQIIRMKVVVVTNNSQDRELIRKFAEKYRIITSSISGVTYVVRKETYYVRWFGVVSIEFLFWIVPQRIPIGYTSMYYRGARATIILLDDTGNIATIGRLIQEFWRYAGSWPVVVLDITGSGNEPHHRKHKEIIEELQKLEAPIEYVKTSLDSLDVRSILRHIVVLLLVHYMRKFRTYRSKTVAVR